MVLPVIALGLWAAASLLRLLWELVLAHTVVAVFFNPSQYLKAIVKVGLISVGIFIAVVIAARFGYIPLLIVTITLGFYTFYCFQNLSMVWRHRLLARQMMQQEVDAAVSAPFRSPRPEEGGVGSHRPHSH